MKYTHKKTLQFLSGVVFITLPVLSSADTEAASQCQLNGIDYKQAQVFVSDLQKALKDNNAEKVAQLAFYPVKINTSEVPGKVNVTVIKTKTDMIKQYSVIFDAKFKENIASVDKTAIFCNYQGAMIASGAVWFQTDSKEKGFFTLNK